MKTIRWIWISLLVGLVFVGSGFAETAKETMRQNLERDDGETQVVRVKIASCRTTRKGGKLSCAERPRIKVLEEVRKDYGPQGKEDTRQVVVIREPPGEQGIGFLQFDYAEEGKENDQWMYFSALGKVKRIVPGNEDEPKTGSFFGTELNYEDIEKRRLHDYTFRFLREETFQKRHCRVIESIPTSKHARQSNYSKIIDWIDTESHIRLKSVMFDRRGRQDKEIIRSGIEQVNGIWTWRTQLIKNSRSQRLSIFKMTALTFNVEVPDDYLALRTLTDSSFREGHLKRYREYLK